MKKTQFHPLLIAIYPGLILLSNNISQVVINDTLRVFLASILLATMSWVLAWVVIRDFKKAALITSLFLLLFFSYGHLFSLVRGISIGPILIGRTLFVFPLFMLVFCLASWLILKRSSANEILNSMSNVISLFLLVVPLYLIFSYHIEAEIIKNRQQSNAMVESARSVPGEYPNIYYIILDMHARSDVLQAIYDYDNTWFIESLRELGFYVADKSTSNYSSTLQSLSSSLNMEYINYLQDIYGYDSINREPFGLLLAQNKITAVLKSKGYNTGAFQSGDFYTEFRDADIYIKPSPEEIRRYQNFWALNSFEGIFLQSTMIRIFYDLDVVRSEAIIENTIETPYQLHRLKILKTVESLPDFALETEPYFVFAHIVSPHPPYVFGPKGQDIKHDQPFSLSGPGRQNGGQKNIKLYVDQLHFVDMIILDTIEEILANSKTPPIIIIQGDHGPVSYNGEDEINKVNMKEQHAILNAFYFPGQSYDLLYPSITPVNSFRIILNTFFDEDYELLLDKNYFIPHARPYEFIDVTNRAVSDPLLP